MPHARVVETLVCRQHGGRHSRHDPTLRHGYRRWLHLGDNILARESNRRRRRLKVPETAQKGEIIVINCLAEHVMQTGRRRDPDTGELIPRFLIERLECHYNGNLV